MGSSFVTLGTKIPEAEQTPWLGETFGVWVKDGPLMTVLTSLGEVADQTPACPDWLKELRAHWIDLEARSPVGVVYTGFKTMWSTFSAVR